MLLKFIQKKKGWRYTLQYRRTTFHEKDYMDIGAGTSREDISTLQKKFPKKAK